MFNGSELRSGVLRAPRVLFDLNCLVIATAAFLALTLCNWLLGLAFDTTNPFGQILTDLSLRLSGVGVVSGLLQSMLREIRGLELDSSLAWWQTALTWFVWLGVWSFFGAAIMRTAALRLTRDEPISLKRAFFFARRHCLEFFQVPVLLALFVGIFVLLTLGLGFVSNIPFVGVIAFFLAALSSVMVALALVGGAIALPVMWAALATERNGPLDALSRAFSYLFARPMQFLIGYVLLFLLMSLVLLFGRGFEESLKTVAGSAILADDLREAVSSDDDGMTESGSLERRAREAIRKIQGGRGTGLSDPENAESLEGWQNAQFWLFWAVLSFFAVLFKGYALYVLFGGASSLYQILRSDVDGTDDDEIFLEDGDPGAAPKRRPVQRGALGSAKTTRTGQIPTVR